jgi:ankyrin repeat protein
LISFQEETNTNEGATALMWAMASEPRAAEDDEDIFGPIVELLLQHGAHVDMQDQVFGFTFLIFFVDFDSFTLYIHQYAVLYVVVSIHKRANNSM